MRLVDHIRLVRTLVIIVVSNYVSVSIARCPARANSGHRTLYHDRRATRFEPVTSQSKEKKVSQSYCMYMKGSSRETVVQGDDLGKQISSSRRQHCEVEDDTIYQHAMR